MLLLQKQASSEKVYEEYILFRAEKLGLDPNSPLNPVLTRIASILQLFSMEEGKILKIAKVESAHNPRKSDFWVCGGYGLTCIRMTPQACPVH